MSENLLDTKLYGLIGEEGFARLVRGFYARVETDDILGPMYRESAAGTGESMAEAEARLRDFLVYRFGGPQRYIERRGHPRLRARHMPFVIDRSAADRWVALMEESMGEADLPAGAAAALRPFFAQVAGFMINKE
jgi:hemoglobin